MKSKADKGVEIFAYVILSLFGLLMLYPLIFSFLASLLTSTEYLQISVIPIPGDLAIERFENLILFFQAENVFSSIGITLARTAFYAFTNIFFGMLAGYIYAKISFRGRKFTFFYLMMSMMLPGVTTLLPSYIMFARWPLVGGNDIFGQGGSGFIGHWTVLFISGWFGAYNIF